MQGTLKRIKRLIIQKRYVFTLKAETEMFREGLTETDVLESVLNANGIKKTIRSKNPNTKELERLHVIESFTYDGLLVYTKGKIRRNENNVDTLYVLISSKRSTSL